MELVVILAMDLKDSYLHSQVLWITVSSIVDDKCVWKRSNLAFESSDRLRFFSSHFIVISVQGAYGSLGVTLPKECTRKFIDRG